MGYTIKQKIEICLRAESHPEMTQGELALWAMRQYGLARAPLQTTILRILSLKHELVALKRADLQLVRRRKQQNPLLRRILTEWITQALWEGIPITVPIIQLTANAIWTRLPRAHRDGLGVFNQKWCNHFLKRLNANLGGDAHDARANPGRHPLKRVWRLDEKVALRQYLRQVVAEGYAPQDVFVLDEFQLFYLLPLDQIFDVLSVNKGLRRPRSLTENLVTIMLGVNVDGLEKLPPMVVGGYDRVDVSGALEPLRRRGAPPGCGGAAGGGASGGSHGSGGSHSASAFGTGAAISDAYRLHYHSNANKWITLSMFQNYLLALEHKLASASPHRRVLLLLDDLLLHRIINLKFSNIRLCYLKNELGHKNPYNCTFDGARFDYLPTSFGIVEEFKVCYRLQQYLEMINVQRRRAAAAPGAASPRAAVTSATIGTYRPPAASTATLAEADYNVPLIKAIEWVQRAWDSIAPERVYLAWRRANVLDLLRPWPARDAPAAESAHALLAPLAARAAHYDPRKTLRKLEEIMGYLNVVIPWEPDALLGLINERGKVTLSYASIDEIIGSCVLGEAEGAGEGADTRAVPADTAADSPAALLGDFDWPPTDHFDPYAFPASPMNISSLLAQPDYGETPTSVLAAVDPAPSAASASTPASAAPAPAAPAAPLLAPAPTTSLAPMRLPNMDVAAAARVLPFSPAELARADPLALPPITDDPKAWHRDKRRRVHPLAREPDDLVSTLTKILSAGSDLHLSRSTVDELRRSLREAQLRRP